MERYVYKDNKALRCGYTTGTCAAAAAQRAVLTLLGAEIPSDQPIHITIPKGLELTIPVEHLIQGDGWVQCGVKKDGGDDPDVTDGLVIYAKASFPSGKKDFNSLEQGSIMDAKVIITGGEGVGKVTKAGLACSVGGPAINPVPRQMIREQVLSACRLLDYNGDLVIEISAPGGAEIAKKTFNPRLGIEGGISILGTSGMVEPMSEQAIVDTIKVEMNVRIAAGARYIVLTPGNYGETFLKEWMKIPEIHTVKCSNFIGEALDYAEASKLDGVLLVGHLGKLVKVGAGIMNTHSKYGDGRMETISAHGALMGAEKQTIEELMDCVTTDEAIEVLDQAGKREGTIHSILKKIEYYIQQRTHHNLQIGAIVFSNKYGYLGETSGAAAILEELR